MERQHSQREAPQTWPSCPVVSSPAGLGAGILPNHQVTHLAIQRPPAGRHPSRPTPGPVLHRKEPQMASTSHATSRHPHCHPRSLQGATPQLPHGSGAA